MSATATQTWESCPARWLVEHYDRAPSVPGSAASLGTACHEVSQRWVEEGHYRGAVDDAVVGALWEDAYWRNFRDGSRYNEGLKLVLTWAHRQDWTGRTVLSTEQKRFFILDTSIGPIPFNYIMDRVDRHDDGDIEVIDYKSLSLPVQPSELHERVQSRAYALAAWLENPTARRVWVTFDLYRYDPVGTVFTAEECEDSRRYFHSVAERIIATEAPAPEILGPECRWCVRKFVCPTLNKHIETAGDTIAASDLTAAAERRFNLKAARQALDSQLAELDDALLTHLVKNGLEEEVLGSFVVSVNQSRRRVVDNGSLASLVPAEIFARMASVGVTAVDELIKSGELDDETASLVRRTMSWNQGARTVNVRRAPQ